MIALFYRNKREGANSIEGVFAAIENKLKPHRRVMLPYSGGGPLVLLKNILFAYKHRGKLNHITGEVHYIALGLGKNTVLTIHDVRSALSGNFLQIIYKYLFWFLLPCLIVKKITVISEATKKDVCKYIPFVNKKIKIISNPYNLKFVAESENHKLCESLTILHVGTKINKNLERVIKALQGITCKLLILGKMSQEQHELAHSLNVKYEEFYDVDTECIIKLYKRCDLVSFPSTFEGFGMPVIEANAMRRPILAGDIPVLRDVAANSALFVNPYSIESIREGFVRILGDADLRCHLIEEGDKNLRRFHPEVISKAYNSIYEEF